MIIGLGWILLASIFLGTFAFPEKFIKNFTWENTWGAFFFFAMFVVPVAFGFSILKGLLPTYSQIPGNVIFGVMSLGFLWGAGFCMWGYGLSKLGLSLGYALTMGTMALCGSMLPFFLGSADKATTPGGMLVIAGILVCIVGVAINGIAGMKRENAAKSASGQRKDNSTLIGVIICVLAGLFSSGCNIAFHIGGSIGKIDSISVNKYGNPAWLGGLAIWVLIFLGGLISSFGYTSYLLTWRRTWKNFFRNAAVPGLSLALLMGLLHFACLFFYGVGGWKLGVLGTSVGFAIFQSGSILVGNLLGFRSGEWKNAPAVSKRWLATGLIVLISGIVIVSIGNYII
ncbi:MAG: hypothetical protein JXJ22_11830 [Bacteroidales bacterium]|nr:hypothetical protein [Bacteroidales bacterium]